MSPSPLNPRSNGSPWAWVPLGLLLAVSFYSQFTERFSLWIEFSYLLPVLTGWLAGRFGVRVFGPLAVYGLLAVFGAHREFSPDLIDLPFTLRAAFSTHTYALSVAAAIQFCEPKLDLPPNLIGSSGRRISLGVFLFVLLLSTGFTANYSVPIGGDRGIEVDVSLVGLLLVSIPILRGRPMTQAMGNQWTPLRRFLAAAFAGLMVLALVIRIRLYGLFGEAFGPLGGVSFGFIDPADLFPVLFFLLAASGWVNWRILTGVGFALLGVSLLSAHLWPALHTAWPSSGHSDATAPGPSTRVWDLAFQFKLTAEVLLDGLSATWLGAAFSSFWKSREVAPLRTWRTPAFLAAVLLLQLVGVPGIAGGYFGLSDRALGLFGGSAFLAGLVWRGRGLLFPLIQQLGCLVAAAALGGDHWQSGTAQLMGLGALSFAWAFFGLLSNRYDPRRDNHASAVASPTVGQLNPTR